MFIVVKSTSFSDNYLKVNGSMYGWAGEKEEATRFESKEKAQTALKTSGFNAYTGLNIEEV